MRHDLRSAAVWLIALPVALALATSIAASIRNRIELDRFEQQRNDALFNHGTVR
jgi:hypothetical protein